MIVVVFGNNLEKHGTEPVGKIWDSRDHSMPDVS